MVGSHARRSRWWRARAVLIGLSVLASLTPGAFAANNPNITIASFSPDVGTVGTEVSITGSNLSAVTSIVFPNGATTFPTLVTSTLLKATVPADASGSGVIVLSNGKKTIPSSSTFAVTPTISNISPTSGAANSTVITITGTGLATLTGVSFTGTPAASFGVNSNTSAWATAPDLSAKPLKKSTLTVTTPGGSAISTQAFSQTAVSTGSPTSFTAADVAQGNYHTCAGKSDGTAWCWGDNDGGQLGNGETVDSLHPVQVLIEGYEGGTGLDAPVPLTGVTQIVAGEVFSCAVASAGVWCWGSNGNGQLGDGTRTDRVNAVRVLESGDEGSSPVPLTQVTSVAAGNDHVCALKQDASVVCWGSNSFGKLGDAGTSGSFSANPVAVLSTAGGPVTLAGVASISAGGSHACAVFTTGQAACWGKNNRGQLGDGTTSDRDVPTRVLAAGGAALSGITKMAGLQSSTCARRSTGSGSVWCWGAGSYGQLGYGSEVSSSTTPVQVITDDLQPLSLVTDVAAGYDHACAVRSDGSAWCWGDNEYAALGDGTVDNRNAAGRVLASGTPALAPVALTGVVRVYTGPAGYGTCAVLAGGGSNVRCWGYNGYGGAGDGVDDTADRLNPVPVRVRPYFDAKQVAVGARHTCAVGTAGTVSCWGYGYSGQLGDGRTDSSADRNRPAYVLAAGDDQFADPRFSGAVALAAGRDHTCALRADGSVWCWGLNARLGHDLGAGVSPNPVRVAGPGGTGWLSGVTAIAAGYGHTCALRSDGTVWCWGTNDYGEAGIGDIATDLGTPMQVVGVGGTGKLSGVTAIATGGSHTCAIRKSGGGSMVCWGFDDHGELGDGNTEAIDGRYAPVQVLGVGGTGTLTGVTSMAAGWNHTCAVRKGGTLVCWGLNASGQIGDGTTVVRPWPTPVLGVGGSGGLTGVVGVVAGGQRLSGSDYSWTCARLSDGRMACWGDQYYGVLGDGIQAESDQLTPTYVLAAGTVEGGDAVTFTGVTALPVGSMSLHVCALVGTRLHCWGYNGEGETGNGGGGGPDWFRTHPFATYGIYDPWS